MEDEATEIRQSIVRDSTFHRSVADKALAIDLGRDFEVAFLQLGPVVTERVVQQGDEEDESALESFSLAPSWTEVSRVRIERSGALNLAMRIITIMAESDQLNLEIMVEHFENLRKSIANSDGGNSDDQ